MILPSELRTCSELSEYAYSRPMSAGGYSSWFSSTKFYLDEFAGFYCLSFRGTREPIDYLIDGLAIPVRYLGSWVHGGFAFAHKSVKKKILKIFDGLNDKPLILTGHSLGAAQAELTHLLAKRCGIESRLICFGKPRVFLRPLRGRFAKDSVFSVVSGSDVVTRLPRYAYTFGCEHQNLLYLANDGDSYLNPLVSFMGDDFSLASGFSDHSMDSYLQRLKGLV